MIRRRETRRSALKAANVELYAATEQDWRAGSKGAPMMPEKRVQARSLLGGRRLDLAQEADHLIKRHLDRQPRRAISLPLACLRLPTEVDHPVALKGNLWAAKEELFLRLRRWFRNP